jgi:excisionase family DNA binding protein
MHIEEQEQLSPRTMFLTREEAADYLYCPKSRIDHCIRSGRLKAYRRTGKRKIYIHIWDLRNLFDGITATPTNPLRHGHERR